MKRRKSRAPDAEDARVTKTKKQHSSGTANNQPACPDCGSTNLVDNGSSEYCSNCGRVTDNTEYASTQLSYAQTEYTGNFISYNNHVYNRDVMGDRLHTRWNQKKLYNAHKQIFTLCQQMQQPGYVDRAKRVFSDYIAETMKNSAANTNVFDQNTEVRVAASVYIAGVEDSRGLALVDVATVARKNLFEVGAAVKQMASTLHLLLPLSDPQMQVTKLVDQLLASGTRCMDNTEEHDQNADLICVPQKKAQKIPHLLLEFLGNQGHMERAKLIRMAGRIVEFCRVGDSHTGMGPATVAGAAVALALEHVLIRKEVVEVLGSGGRQVVVRLVALMAKAGPRVVQRYLMLTIERLCLIAERVPWLRDISVSADIVGMHLPDILFFHDSSRGWLFGSEPEESTDPRAETHNQQEAVLIEPVDFDAPSFARAEDRRTRRQKILCSENNASENRSEASVVKQLWLMGVEKEALLNLPLHTLSDLQSVVERQRGLTDDDKQRLDSETITANDMPDEEALAYLCRLDEVP
ncbi:hypothetical protein GGF40_003465 [Coemansia sp. RSA 1286]|nr:hypothetical protein GGF40_003465 [Coemansia sp. RSA 1286]